MAKTSEQLAHRAALAAKDWAEAARIVRANPDQFGAPPPGVSDEIAAVANDPLEPGWMIVEWSTQKNDCQGQPGCRPYTLHGDQFDHKPATTTEAEANALLDKYVANRKTEGPSKDQLGQTLFLVEVKRIVPITDFDGVLIDD